jgi:hypothetical protein
MSAKAAMLSKLRGEQKEEEEQQQRRRASSATRHSGIASGVPASSSTGRRRSSMASAAAADTIVIPASEEDDEEEEEQELSDVQMCPSPSPAADSTERLSLSSSSPSPPPSLLKKQTAAAAGSAAPAAGARARAASTAKDVTTATASASVGEWVQSRKPERDELKRKKQQLLEKPPPRGKKATAASRSKTTANAARSSAAGAELTPWSCGVCTLDNEASAAECAACQSKRMVAAPPAATKARAKSKTKPVPKASGRARKKQRASSDDEVEEQGASAEESDSEAATRKKGSDRRLKDMWGSQRSQSLSQSQSQSQSQGSPPDGSSQGSYRLTLVERTSSRSKTPASPPGSGSGSQQQRQSHHQRRKREYQQLEVHTVEDDDDHEEGKGGDDDVHIVGRAGPLSPKSAEAAAAAAVARSKRRKLAAASDARRANFKLDLIEASNSRGSEGTSRKITQASAVTTADADPPSVLWIDKYAPRREDELAVHARKLAEVKGWLAAFGKPAPPRGSSSLTFQAAAAGKDPRYGHGQGMLILTGPAGCGKSAMLRVLAAELGYQIVSWDDESGDSGAGAESSFGFGNGGHHHGGHGFERKMNVFRSFFATATRYSLALSQLAPAAGSSGSPAAAASVTLPARSLVLIEELPYIGREEFRAEFLSVLTSALAMSRHPIVLCLTTENESAGGSGVELAIERLFGKELLQHPRVAVIKANPINNTELIKALQRVIKSDNTVATLHLSAFLVCGPTGQLISVAFSCAFFSNCFLPFCFQRRAVGRAR